MSPLRRATGILLLVLLTTAAPAAAAKKPPTTGGATFSFGQPQADTVGAKGCGTNTDGEPAIHVSRANNVFFSSERGLGGGTDAWRALGGVGGPGANACAQAEYRGQPNAVQGTGASGGDTDLAIAPEKNATGA